MKIALIKTIKKISLAHVRGVKKNGYLVTSSLKVPKHGFKKVTKDVKKRLPFRLPFAKNALFAPKTLKKKLRI